MNERIRKLTDKDVWIFTKQETSFVEAFIAVLMFERAKELHVNIEQYFLDNYTEFGLNTDRHRILSSSQLFGLLTKTPFNSRGEYNNENPTPIFYLLKKHRIGDNEFNKLQTEQILKVKIRAIIDNAGNNISWNVLPVIYTYNVLKKLKYNFNINKVSESYFYSYILTSSRFEFLDETVEGIAKKWPISQYLKDYKSNSRIKPFFQKNIDLFVFDQYNNISINEDFEYLFDRFLNKIDIESISENIEKNEYYSSFLTNSQDFNINLIKQNLVETLIVSDEEKSLDTKEENYFQLVNNLDSKNLNVSSADDAFKSIPKLSQNSSKETILRNPIVGKISIKKSDFKCNLDSSHETFISKTTNEQYMEPHHLIPISNALLFWEKYKINIDCPENILALCPNCHKAIHLSNDRLKLELLKKMYELKKDDLKKINLDLSFEQIKKFYSL